MLFKQLILWVLCAFVAISACKKPDDGKFVFHNNTDSVIFIDIYTSSQDYYDNHHPVVSGYIDAQSTFDLLASPLGETIYVDWYSQQGTLTNWLPDNADEARAYTIVVHPQKEKQYHINNPSAPIPLRDMLLNGNEKETTWKAVDAFEQQGTNTVSVWGQLGNNEKDATITFRKNFTLTYITPMVNEQHSYTSENRGTYKIISIDNWGVMGNGAEPSGKWITATSLMNDTLALV